MVPDSVGEGDDTGCVLYQIFEMEIEGSIGIELLPSVGYKYERIIWMSLTVDSDLFFADDVSLLSALFYGKIKEFVTESHGVGEVTYFLPHYQNLEILCSADIGDEAWAFLHDFFVKLTHFF